MPRPAPGAGHPPALAVCPWKGVANYYDVVVDGRRLPAAVWTYEEPSSAARHIAGHVAFGGRLGDPTLNAVPLGHVLSEMVRFMEDFEHVVRPSRFSEPAPAMLHLLVKCGYTLVERAREPRSSGGGCPIDGPALLCSTRPAGIATGAVYFLAGS